MQIHSAATFAPAWDKVFLEWLLQASTHSWRSPAPTLIVVPFRSDAYWLKTRLLEAGQHALGIQFVTPAELRGQLFAQLNAHQNVPLREHLQLLLAAAAETVAEIPGQNPDTLAASHAVAGAPDHLLHAIDQLSAGGWEFTDAGPAALRPIVQEFQRLMKRCGFELMHDADRQLPGQIPESKPLFANLFIAGFSGANWPLWPLLSAAVAASGDATVCLLEPRAEAEDLDATWMGSWEERFGAAHPIPAGDGPESPFCETLRLPETPVQIEQRQRQPVSSIEFLVGQNALEQARAIVTKTLQFLGDKSCVRLGILLPAGGALAREVALLLGKHSVPHNDGLAHFAPGPFEAPAWTAWLALQDSPRIEILLRFLHTHPCLELFDGLTVDTLENSLRRAFSDLLIDDLSLLAQWLGHRRSNPVSLRVAEGLRRFPFLPESARFEEFLSQSLTIFQQLGWGPRGSELERLSRSWSEGMDVAISRRAYLRWLEQVLLSFRTLREASGNHPYSRVQLLPYTQSETQPWSHLILGGLNEGAWPQPFDDGGYIGEEEIETLNGRIRRLNKKALLQGVQGEGHSTVEPGKTLCLGPSQKRDLSLRQLLNTLESTTQGIAVCASLFEEAQPDRRLNPSEYFTRLYFCARGKALSHTAMSALGRETGRWLESSGLWRNVDAPTPSDAVRQTRIAFDARRDGSLPFGQYEFGLREKTAHPIRLSATEWERALSAPATTWMKKMLGVTRRVSGIENDPWSQATGQWTHRWLGAISGTKEPNAFVPLPSSAEILRRTRAQAEHFRASVHELLAGAERSELPDWWVSGWRQALSIAHSLADALGALDGPYHLATEWSVPPGEIELGAGSTLHIHGRIDLLLGGSEPGANGLPNAPWIVDYKTGRKTTLAPKTKTPEERALRLARKFASGDSLQLALYALALRQLGATSLGVSLLTLNLPLDTPQLSLDDINSQQSLWLGLLQLQETGVFGMHGPLRDEFAFGGDYPLATLAIDPAVLDAKWQSTHPQLSNHSEEDSE